MRASIQKAGVAQGTALERAVAKCDEHDIETVFQLWQVYDVGRLDGWRLSYV